MKTSIAAAFGLPTLHDPSNILVDHERLIDSSMVDGQVVAAMAPLRFDPEPDSETLTYVLKGEPLQVLGEKNNWLLVISVIDGYLGWLDQTAVSTTIDEPTHRVSTPLSHIYSAPDLRSKPTCSVTMGSYLKVTGSAQNSFMPLETGGWVFNKHVSVIGNFASDPTTVAESMIGAPYLWGGRSKLGIDCSGLVQLALASCGHRVHRDSNTQFESLGRLLDDGELPMRGDLAFFPGHVGWMIDGIHLLHANATNMAVTINTVEEVAGWIAEEIREQVDLDPSEKPENTSEIPSFLGYKRL